MFENCPDTEQAQLIFPQHQILDPAIENALNASQGVIDLIEQGLDFNGNHNFEQFFQRESNLRQLQDIYKAYRDAKQHFSLGMALGAYRILGVASFLMSLNILTQGQMNSNISCINEYSILLPILVLVFDNHLPKISKREEHQIFKRAKRCFMAFYWALIIASLVLYQLYPPTMTKK